MGYLTHFMTRIMAQGTFDILHPGHIHYLRTSGNLGEELVVVVARDSRLKGRKKLYFSEDERREMLKALEMVDKVVLGSEKNIYSTVEKIDPDIITLGYDQEHETEEVRKMAKKATGHEVKVERIGKKENYSSSNIKDF